MVTWQRVAISFVVGLLQLGAVFLMCWQMDTLDFGWISFAVSGVLAVWNAVALVFTAHVTVGLVWPGP